MFVQAATLTEAARNHRARHRRPSVHPAWVSASSCERKDVVFQMRPSRNSTIHTAREGGAGAGTRGPVIGSPWWVKKSAIGRHGQRRTVPAVVASGGMRLTALTWYVQDFLGAGDRTAVWSADDCRAASQGGSRSRGGGAAL